MLKDILSLINLSPKDMVLSLSIMLNVGLTFSYHESQSKRIDEIRTIEEKVRVKYDKSIEELSTSNSRQLIRCSEEKELILKSSLTKIDSIERKTIDLYRKYELLNKSIVR